MTFEITPDGLEIETFDEIYERLSSGLKVIYGSGINLDQNSPDGQRLGIWIKEVMDSQSFASSLYSNLDIDFSFGTFQEVLVKLTGIYKKSATQSQWDIIVNVIRDFELGSGFTVKDEDEQTWSTRSNYNVTAGDNIVTVFSDAWGAIEQPGSEITEVTITPGIASLSAPNSVLVGHEEETEPDIRIRRNRSLGNPSYSILGGLIAKLLALNSVTDVQGYENKTKITDDRGIPGNTIWIVVEGGDVADIAEIMTKQKTGGCNEKGDLKITHYENIARDGRDDLVISHEFSIDRPVLTELYVKINAGRKIPSVPVDTDLIKEKISGKTFYIAEDAESSRLYPFAFEAGDSFILYDLEVSIDDVTYTDETILSELNGKFIIDVNNVVVNEIAS